MQPGTNDSLKIIILSFQRNATQSTFEFLKENNFAGVHHLTSIHHSSNFRGWSLEEIQEYAKSYEDDFVHFSDAPYFMMYEYFDKKYPKAKFILIERNPHDWLKSFRKLNSAVPLDPISRACHTKYVSEMVEISDTEMDKITDNALLDMYNTHNLEVKKYFENKKNLLVLDIDDPQKEDRLIEFLDLESKPQFKNYDFVRQHVY